MQSSHSGSLNNIICTSEIMYFSLKKIGYLI